MSLTDFGVCLLPVVPCRKSGSDKAEMVTQLLFGQTYRVEQAEKKWLLIEIAADGYNCWIDLKQHHPISPEEFEKLTNAQKSICWEILADVRENEQAAFKVPMGSVLPGMDDQKFKLAERLFAFGGNTNTATLSPEYLGKTLLNAPYLWGGKTVLGIDCSGFIQVVFSAAGIELPRDAYQQAEIGETVDFIGTAEEGDLAYFDNKKGKITHVGIVLADGKIIHASGKVRIDLLDHNGIFNREENAYTHSLCLIKRISD